MKFTAKEQHIIEEIRLLLPGITISPLRAGNADEVNQVHYFIPPDNKSLEHSKYYYKGHLHFIHFTGLKAVRSIIKGRNIRLYNLRNLNDPREYSFAGDLITIDSERRNDAKDNFYLFSMCKTSLLNNSRTKEIEFNMWRLYGDSGKGAAIEVSFSESPLVNWRDYFLSNVFYGISSNKNLRRLYKLLSLLEKEKPEVFVDLGQIACFHKSRLFRLERETRLLYDNRKIKIIGPTTYSFQGDTSPIIKTDTSKHSDQNDKIKYLKLPIYHSKFNDISGEAKIPVPKIEKIILGYQFKDNFDTISNQLMNLCKKHLGYLPKIEKSRLTKLYHDT